MDVAQVVPVTLFQNPDAWLVLSTKPQEDPEVANWRLTSVGPGCSANYMISTPCFAAFQLATYIRIKESKVLCQLRQKSSLLLIVGLDDKGGVTGSLAVLLGLALNEATHIRSVIVGRVPLAEDLIAGTSKVVVRVLQWHLSLVRSCADLQWLVPDSPVGVGVLIAESTVAQVVDIRVEVPVTGNVVERVVLKGQVDNVLDLCEDVVSRRSFLSSQ